MPWGAVAGAVAGSVANSALSDSGGGGGQTASQSRQPWMPATPWLMNNLAQGQTLQSQYQNQPFNAQQQQAYQNQANQGAYMRAAVPSLLRQMQGKQIGFDRSNPNARPEAFNWDGLLSAAKEGQSAQDAQAGQSGGLLDMLTSGSTGAVNSSLTPMAEPPKKEETGTFTQQTINWSPQQQAMIDSGRSPWMFGGGPDSFVAGNQAFQGDGGYGEFRYGMDVPKAGTKAYRDMQEYFLNGGLDPYGKYGERRFGGNWAVGSMLGNSGDSVGGSAAADGSGGGSPGAY